MRRVAVIAVAGLTLGGCGGGARDAQRPSPPTGGISAAVSTAATPTVAPVGAATLAAYRGMWEDWVALAATGDYQNPRLANHASGRALSLIYKAIYKDRAAGLHSEGRPVLSPKIVAMTPESSPDRATVSDCVDTSPWVSVRSTGERQADSPSGRHAVQALAVLGNGMWKVDQLVIQDLGTC